MTSTRCGEGAPNQRVGVNALHRRLHCHEAGFAKTAAGIFNAARMTTYVYETIPQIPGVEPRRFEVRQSMNDAPLKRDPETGEPVRRVISGGYGFVAQKMKGGTAPAAAHSCSGNCRCCAN